MTENTNEKLNQEREREKGFDRQGEKFRRFPLFFFPHHAHRRKHKANVEKEELEDIEIEGEFLFFSSGGLLFLKPPLLFVAQGRGGGLMARRKDVVPPKVGKRGFGAACCCCNVR